MATENKIIGKVNVWFTALSQRERIIVLLALFLVPIYLFVELSFLPAQKQQKLLASQYQTAQQDNLALQLQSLELQGALNNDPDQKKRDQIAQLHQQIADFDVALQRNLTGLVPPQQMAAMLRGMLSQHQGLTLMSLKNSEPYPLVTVAPIDADDAEISGGQAAPSKQSVPVLYRHSIEVKMSGSYLATLRYLRQLQGLSQRLFWGGVDIEMSDHYPNANVILNVYTLSFQEGWIGG